MTNSKSTKRALLASALSLAVCCAMLIGTTFAWFTDSVTSSGNKIMAGNLKADLIHVGGGEEGADVSIKENPDHKIFNYDKWEPGYTTMETLKVVNKGNLAFKFRLDAVTVGEIAGENGEKLSDVIDVYVYEGENVPTPDSFADMTEANGWRNAGSLSKLMADPDGIARGELLPAGATPKKGEPVGSVQMTVALHMQESAGNEYQGLSLGNLNFTLNATQYTYEDDSFNDQYDKDAEYNVINADKENIQSVLDDVSVNTVVQLDEGDYDDFEMRLIGDKGIVSEPQNFEYKPSNPYYYHSERKIQNLVIRGVDEKDEGGYYKTEIGNFKFAQGLNKYRDDFPGIENIQKWEHTYSSFDVDGLTFENIHFTGQVNLEKVGDFGAFKNITFKNCTFDASAEDYSDIQKPATIDYLLPAVNSIRTAGIENLVIDSCTFKGNATYWNNMPLYLTGCDNITLKNSTFTNCGKNAMQIVNYGGDITIDGNRFVNTPDRAFKFWGNNNNANIVITGNDFNASHDTDGEAVQIDDSSWGQGVEFSLTVSGNKWTPKDGQEIIKGVVMTNDNEPHLDTNPQE